MALVGLSDEQSAFAKSSRCPNGHFLMGTLRLTDSGGQQVSVLKAYPLMDRGTVAECPECGITWPVFKSGPAGTAVPSRWRVVAITEAERFEEPIGSDSRVLDSSQSTLAITRSLTFTKEWAQTTNVEVEKTQTVSGGAGISLGEIVSLEASAEQAISSHYGITTETRRVEEEHLELPVPAGVRVRVTLHWKRVWQAGVVRLADEHGLELEVPFSVVVGLTFDQQLLDEPQG